MDKNVLDLIYLSSCAVNGIIPKNTERIDLDGVYKVAEKHSMKALASYALESTGKRDKRTSITIGQAIRKVSILEKEKKALFGRLEEAGIWYMPLKGAVLKEYYPLPGMREMADYDILYDGSRAEDLKKIMEQQGFTTIKFDNINNQDVFFKKPVVNFEMHRCLFNEFLNNSLYLYYLDIKERMIKDDWNGYGYHLKSEDFYIYMISHEYKHFKSSGTGLRSLLDTYVYLKKNDCLNWQYINEQITLLGIQEFEEQNRELALQLFEGKTSDNTEMLNYMIDAGTYGNIWNKVGNRIEQQGDRRHYIFSRMFIPIKVIEKSFPTAFRHKFLVPFLPFYRLWLLRKKGYATLITELKVLWKKKH